MKRRKLPLAVILLFAMAVSAVTASGLDLNPPLWRGDPYSTTQQWEFLAEDYQPYADSWNNPFGQMQIEVLTANTIQYYDALNSAMKWENLEFLGFGDESQQMMRIETWPNWPDTATNKKAWVQMTWGVDFHGATPPYDRASMLYLSSIGIDGIFPTPAIDAQTLDVDGTIEWYHTTFQIPFINSHIEYDEFGNSWIVEEDAPWSSINVYPYAGGVLTPEPLTSPYDIYISQVVVDTICVPEPTTLALMVAGIIGLRRRK